MMKDDLEKQRNELAASVKSLRERLDDAREKLARVNIDIFIRDTGVRPDSIIESDGKLFRVGCIKASGYGWVEVVANPQKKDGTFGRAIKNFYQRDFEKTPRTGTGPRAKLVTP